MHVCTNRPKVTSAALADGAEIGLNLSCDCQETMSRYFGCEVAKVAKFEAEQGTLEPGKPPRLADSDTAIVLRPA